MNHMEAGNDPRQVPPPQRSCAALFLLRTADSLDGRHLLLVSSAERAGVLESEAVLDCDRVGWRNGSARTASVVRRRLLDRPGVDVWNVGQADEGDPCGQALVGFDWSLHSQRRRQGASCRPLQSRPEAAVL